MRRPTLDESNRLFTAVMIGLGGVVGSGISFLLSGGILAGLLRLYQGKIPLPSDRRVLLIGLAFAGYFLAEAFAALINYQDVGTLLQIVPHIPFLAFVLIYGRLSLSRRGDVLRAAEIGAVVGSLGALAFAVVQTAVIGERAEGLAGNPGPFALICAVLYGLSIIAAIRHRGGMKYLAALGVIAAASALVLSGMRSLWPALLIVPILLLVLFRFKAGGRKWGHAALVLAGMVFVSALVGQELVQTRIQGLLGDYESVTADADFDNSLGQRLRLWSIGLELAAEKPLFGHGPVRARFSLKEQSPDGSSTRNFSHYHNFILNAVVRSGIVGLFATLFMLLAPVWIAARQERDEIADAGYAMLAAVLLAYMMSGMFNIMLGHDILDALFIYSYIVGTFLVLGSRDHSSGRSSPDRRSQQAEAAALGLQHYSH